MLRRKYKEYSYYVGMQFDSSWNDLNHLRYESLQNWKENVLRDSRESYII